MSRWKDTLCGKAIPTAVSQTISNSLGDNSAVLSCGGVFLPQTSPSASRAKNDFCLHLPKNHYEILVPSAGGLNRYGGKVVREIDEVDVLDEMFDHSGLKL